MIKIFIDPGHGGTDPGAVGHRLKEKDITLAIALKVRKILEDRYTGHVIKLSRTTDQTLSLRMRTNMANKWGADYFLSIHINAGGGTGFESFIYSGNHSRKKQNNQLRTAIHQKIIGKTRFADRGRKEANFHVLRESVMPAILTENGFIDQQLDADQLKNEQFLTTIAQGHVDGLVKAFLLQTKHPYFPQQHLIKKGDTLWALAQKYGTTVAQLKEVNKGIIPERLQIGQKITIR